MIEIRDPDPVSPFDTNLAFHGQLAPVLGMTHGISMSSHLVS
jgi:hypothetical protein